MLFPPECPLHHFGSEGLQQAGREQRHAFGLEQDLEVRRLEQVDQSSHSVRCLGILWHRRPWGDLKPLTWPSYRTRWPTA